MTINPTRRDVLRSAGAVAAVGAACAACGSSSGSGSAPATSATSAASGATLTPTAGVPVGGGVILTSARVVVTQPTSGQFKGFSTTCPHAGCAVASVANGQILCPCHGSLFSVTDGSVVQGPAQTGLTPVAVTVKGADVVSA